MKHAVAATLVLGLALAACDSDEAVVVEPFPVTPAPVGAPYPTLDAWHVFRDARLQTPADRVEPYDVTSPLFSDYTAKHRFFWLPEGTTMTYTDSGPWQLPVGAIVIKTFAYPIDERDPSKGERIMETRLLVHEPSGWVPHTYVWDEAQTTATRKVAGDVVPVTWVDASGAERTNRYVVPNTNECQECHAKEPATNLLGVRTGQIAGLPGVDLIDAWQAKGYFTSAPSAAPARAKYAAPDDASVAVSLRARAYLEANCAHCHNPDGDAGNKALYLDFAHTDPATQSPVNWGVCKIPTSAGGATCGRTYDVVPGDADNSVMLCRMESTLGADQMPPIGRALVHVEGVALIKAWVDSMEPDDCR